MFGILTGVFIVLMIIVVWWFSKDNHRRMNSSYFFKALPFAGILILAFCSNLNLTKEGFMAAILALIIIGLALIWAIKKITAGNKDL